MSPPSTKPPVVPVEEDATTPAAPNGFASRAQILDAAGNFTEEEHDLEGVGKLLLSELSGAARAGILGELGIAIQDNRLTDPLWTERYQKTLLGHGVIDPSSPPGDRKPLFKQGDLDRLMQLGGAKITGVVDAIERLSRMGRYQESAEKNSAGTQNGASISG